MEHTQLVALLEQAKLRAQSWDSVKTIRKTQQERKKFHSAQREVVSDVLNRTICGDRPIFDLGAGLGDLFGLLPDHLLDSYVPIEPSPTYSRALMRDWPGLTPLRAMGNNLPLRSASANTVIAMNLLDILEPPDPVIAEVRRILGPDGRFIHFHDLLPDPVVFMLELEGIPFPRFEEGRAISIMAVPIELFNRIVKRLPQGARNFANFYAEHPGLYEVARFHPQLEGWLREISRRLMQAGGSELSNSPPMVELFEDYSQRKLEAAGFSIEEMGGQTAAVGGPVEQVDWFHELPYFGPDEPINLVTKMLGGSWAVSHSSQILHDYGPGFLVIQMTMHVIVAREPPAKETS